MGLSTRLVLFFINLYSFLLCVCVGAIGGFDAFEEIPYYPDLILGVPESTQDMNQRVRLI
jgi:hypothetical protein